MYEHKKESESNAKNIHLYLMMKISSNFKRIHIIMDWSYECHEMVYDYVYRRCVWRDRACSECNANEMKNRFFSIAQRKSTLRRNARKDRAEHTYTHTDKHRNALNWKQQQQQRLEKLNPCKYFFSLMLCVDFFFVLFDNIAKDFGVWIEAVVKSRVDYVFSKNLLFLCEDWKLDNNQFVFSFIRSTLFSHFLWMWTEARSQRGHNKTSPFQLDTCAFAHKTVNNMPR